MKKIFLIVFAVVLLAWLVSAGVSYCCEKTVSGAWCQNAPQDHCDASYHLTPSSCESTSYCRLGTCIDSGEGTCMENTPSKVCQDSHGVWYDKSVSEIPQCSLGCCLLGDQAAYVTKTRCKRLSSLYGLETNFRSDIRDEFQCIASANSEEKGACVFEKEFERRCLFLTQAECNRMKEGNRSVEFYGGRLCSDESLNTNCGPSKKTTCVDGKDEVYFVDTCGNIANIYDASKINDKNYWSKVISKSESCGYDSSNANSANCGNCDYYSGSTCGEYNHNKNKVKPNYGDNICRDLSCEYKGKKYKHGETWCEHSGTNKNGNLPGGRYFRLVCYDGEVSVEPCADYRQEVCVESDINDFKTASCRVNKWQDCTSQSNKKDCENKDRRDCKWVKDLCVPEYPPGFDFWETNNDGTDICSQGNTNCVVVFEKNLLGSEKCIKNCECLFPQWKEERNNVCTSLGDCGSKNNFLGIKGYND